MRKLIRNVSIKIPSFNVLRIPGLIREFKHSNSNMLHRRLTSKGSLFFGTPCMSAVDYIQRGGPNTIIVPYRFFTSGGAVIPLF